VGMEILQAILLGIIEGLTEFLPVSSTGHLIITEEYIDFKDTAKIFTVAIQSGAIAAVIWHYRVNLSEKFKGLANGDKTSRNFFINLAIATIPAGLLAFALSDYFADYATPRVVATALIAGALVLWVVDKKVGPPQKNEKPQMDKIKPRQALIAGLAQCVALIPGTSRSASAIVGGLLGGLNRSTATELSFYMAVPILLAAGSYKLVTGRHDLASVDGGLASIIAGTIASFIVASIAISWLLKYISNHSFKIFVYYRLVLGVVVLILLAN
jgi:undecaprenyl-diphosphatase